MEDPQNRVDMHQLGTQPVNLPLVYFNLASSYGPLRLKCGNNMQIGHPHMVMPTSRAKCCCGSVCYLVPELREAMPRGGGVFRNGALAFGLAFLYAPIVLLVVYSFNESRLVTVWAGFSTRWYGELARNDAFLAAAVTSLEVATLAACAALVLGTAAGFSLARFLRFPGRALFGFAILAPLVVPEVILGLSLLLLFVACENWLGWPGRGMLTIAIAHATFASCFVAILVRAQLAGFDRALEEAASDLGAGPWAVLWRVTLPGIRPALVSGWLLAFTLSLDDLVVASFVSGPSATTLPMAVFSSVRLGVSPQVNALATLFLAAVLALVTLAFWLIAQMERRRNP